MLGPVAKARLLSLGNSFGEGRGQLSPILLGLELLSISALRCAVSLSSSTGSLSQSSRSMFLLGYGFALFPCQGTPNHQLVLHQFLTSINCLINQWT